MGMSVGLGKVVAVWGRFPETFFSNSRTRSGSRMWTSHVRTRHKVGQFFCPHLEVY